MKEYQKPYAEFVDFELDDYIMIVDGSMGEDEKIEGWE